MRNELDVYRPHTTGSNLLLKRAEEDKIFQLLSSLESEYEDLCSHILMNPKLPTNVCATIQREEVRKKVMNTGASTTALEARAYFSSEKKHLSSDKKGSEDLLNFTSNPTTLINEFVAYLQLKKEDFGSDEVGAYGNGNSTAMLGKFAGFLADSKKLTQDNMQVANGEGAKVLGMGIHLVSDNIESKTLDEELSFEIQPLNSPAVVDETQDSNHNPDQRCIMKNLLMKSQKAQ
ncbi:unnamed protein product [Malus baccata var. baccata]